MRTVWMCGEGFHSIRRNLRESWRKPFREGPTGYWGREYSERGVIVDALGFAVIWRTPGPSYPKAPKLSTEPWPPPPPW